MKSEVYKMKMDRREELLTRILDAAARIKKHKDKLRRKTRHLARELQSALMVAVGF